jgi:tetratricopeptide (TPR) repeat protein
MKRLIAASAVIVLLASAGFAQKAKSKAEQEALMKVQNAATPADQIKAIDDVLDKFADTEFKPVLLSMAADAASRMHDYEKTMIYGERAVAADPKNPDALYTLAGAIVLHTREHDLDRDEKLTKAEKLCNDGIGYAKVIPNPQPSQISDALWEQTKKDKIASFYNLLAMSADLKKDYPTAINNFKTALGFLTKPDPVILARLAKSYNNAGQYDDGLATADKVLADSSATQQIKNFATLEKNRATKAKAEPAAPAAPK